MPLLNAAGYSVPQAPTEAPSLVAPSRTLDIRATPEAFGSQIGQSLTQLGRSVEQAGDVLATGALQRQEILNRIATTEQENWAEKEANNLLYGDPDVPGDTGFRGKRGQDAVQQWPNFYRSVDERYKAARANLQNDAQRLAFDQSASRVRRFMLAEGGRHYDQQTQVALDAETKASVQLSQNAASRAANIGDFGAFKAALANANEKLATQVRSQGLGDDVARARIEENTSQMAKTWALALGDRDPLGAQHFLDAHKTMFNDNDFAEMGARFRARAKELQAIEDVNGTGKTLRGSSGQLLRGGGVDAALDRIEQKESGGRNIHQGLVPARVSSAQGNFQITNETWRDFAPRVDSTILQKWPTAMQAPYEVQRSVARKILTEPDGGPERWKALTPDEISTIKGELGASAKSTDFNLAWGDSIAHGVKGAAKIEGNTLPGRTPRQVLDTIEEADPEQFKGKNIYLSSGASNNTAETALVAQQLDKLKAAGANVVLAGVGSGVKNYQDVNKQLAAIAQEKGVPFTGELADTSGGRVHPRNYALAAGQGQAFVTQTAGPADRVIPPPDRDMLPDADVPGLPPKLEELNKRLAGASDERRLAAFKLLRQQMNDAYTNAQRSRNIQRQQQADLDDSITNQFLGRMRSDSPSYPTLDEVKGNTQLSPKGKENLLGLIRADTRGEPDRAISAQNYPTVLTRIMSAAGTPEHIDSKDQIYQERIAQRLTNADMNSLIQIFEQRNNPRTAQLVEARKTFLNSYLGSVAPSAQLMGDGIAKIVKPEEGKKYHAWVYSLYEREAALTKVGKNPVDLYNPENPEFPGKDEAMKPYTTPFTVGATITPVAPAAPAPAQIPGLSPENSARAAKIRDDLAAKKITREEAEEMLRSMGLRNAIAVPVR